jgi:hypothetical protein
LYRLDNTMTGRFEEITSDLHINIDKNNNDTNYDFDSYIKQYKGNDFLKPKNISFSINHHLSMELFPIKINFKYWPDGNLFIRTNKQSDKN